MKLELLQDVWALARSWYETSLFIPRAMNRIKLAGTSLPSWAEHRNTLVCLFSSVRHLYVFLISPLICLCIDATEAGNQGNWFVFASASTVKGKENEARGPWRSTEHVWCRVYFHYQLRCICGVTTVASVYRHIISLPWIFWLPACFPSLSLSPQMSLGPFLIRDLLVLLVWY